ncbi:GAF domain-containing protein [Geoalkalibacter halelectricus]|uniref:histidine kinase n=1 Tax=Geoalkalibacter halelectricus TaxID=2847045 RepID=A0ABY5ZNY6_9BACT|nr:GAF domain-containing protein [Geoalkalibacter halelectricus]MDO3379773.1 GAF domain-containing protein [Geoalkalibacter halelectricus]UWZ79595.1 GAF domain-containing protein [Geoalkalibacter halelectricus]
MTENAQAKDLCEKKLEILQEISSAIILSDNISAIANIMLDLAINHTGAEKGSLMLANDQQQLSIFTSRGLDENLSGTYRTAIGEGIAGKVAESREAVLVTDIERDPRFAKTRDRYKTRSFISCPIIGKTKLLGVLNINDKKSGEPFSEDDLTLIQIIANQAAIALKNAFLVNQLKAKAAEHEEINRKFIEASLAKTEFLTRVSHELRTPLNSTKGAVYYLRHSDKLNGGDFREFMDILTLEIDKMINIVENQLDFLRLEDESSTLHRTIINLERALRETLDSRLLKSKLLRKDIKVRVDFTQDLPDVAGDRVMVAQFFINLLEGILPHLEAGSRLTFSGRQNEHLHLTMATDRTLPQETADFFFSSRTLFDPERSDENLKLYLARKSAEVHNWKFDFANTDAGFIVDIQIPRGTRQRVEAAVNTTMDLFLDFVSELLAVNTCSIMLSDELTQDLVIRSARGLDADIIKKTRIRVGERIAGWVAHEGKPLLVTDIREDPRFAGSPHAAQYTTPSFMSLPLKIDGRTIGVINLNNKRSGDPFSEADLQVASVLSERIAHLIEKMHDDGHTEEDLRRIIASFDNLVGAERKLPGKSRRRQDLASRLLARLDISDEQRRLGLYLSMVYDLGLMLIDDSVLGKTKKLSFSEISTLRIHPHATVDLLKDIEHTQDVRTSILHHHEWFDGSGYPEGLKGEQIPLLSRIIAIIDAWCAMTEDRPYRKKMSEQEALAELRRKAGSQFDPALVEVFAEVV